MTNVLADFSAALVFITALFILLENASQHPASLPLLAATGRIPASFSIGMLMLGVALFVALDSKIRDRQRFRWLVKTTLVLLGITTVIAVAMLVQDLHQGVQLSMSSILLFTTAVLFMLLSRRLPPIVLIYGVGLPATWILFRSLYALIMPWFASPNEVAALSFPAALGFFFASMAMLTGTMPQGGLMAPLGFSNRRARLMALTGLVVGLSILLFSVAASAAAYRLISPAWLQSPQYAALHSGSRFVAIMVCSIVTVLGMRLAFFYNEAETKAEAQRQLAEREAMLRGINEAIHSTLNLDGVFEIIVNMLGSLIQVDRCLICRYDSKSGRLFPPTQEYRSSDSVPSMLGENPDFEKENLWAAHLVLGKNEPVQFDVSDPHIPAQALAFLQRLEVRSGVIAPVVYDGQMIALLLVHQTSAESCLTGKIDIIRTIVVQAAIAVHQAELYEEKLQAEALLQRQLSFTRSLTDNLGEGVFALDDEYKVVFMNPAAERMLGWKSGEMLTQPILKAIRATRMNAGLQELENGPQLKLPQSCEDTFVRKNGGAFPVSCTYSRFPMGAGRKNGLIFVFRDMSRQKRAEKDLQLYAVRLERSNKDLEHFAYLASHDLQAPLIKLQKFSEILKKIEPLNSEGLDIVNRMQASAQKMQSMVLDILALARISTSTQPFEPLALGDVIEDVLNDYSDKINKLHASIEVGRMETLEADPVQIRQLMQNLLDNALKFHRPGVPPQIRIFTRRLDDHYCQIIVEDNGIGFKEEATERIFEMFERLHGLSKYEGNGIGLAICKKTAERHHGSITARSIPNEGSTFITTLPIKQSA